MVKFPIRFEARAASPAGAGTTWKAESGSLSPIVSAIPPEFNGPGGGYSPEDLFALALLNCLIATFKVYAEKSNVTFREIQAKADLTVDKVPGQSGFMMTQADVFLDVAGASDPELGKKLLNAAIKDCAISNSIKTGKTFHITFS